MCVRERYSWMRFRWKRFHKNLITTKLYFVEENGASKILDQNTWKLRFDSSLSNVIFCNIFVVRTFLASYEIILFKKCSVHFLHKKGFVHYLNKDAIWYWRKLAFFWVENLLCINYTFDQSIRLEQYLRFGEVFGMLFHRKRLDRSCILTKNSFVVHDETFRLLDPNPWILSINYSSLSNLIVYSTSDVRSSPVLHDIIIFQKLRR